MSSVTLHLVFNFSVQTSHYARLLRYYRSVIAAPAETTSAATTRAPAGTGSIAHIQLISSDKLCIGAPNASLGTNLTLAPCGGPLTVFELPGGAPTAATQLALNTNSYVVRVNARDLAANASVFLDGCQDDAYERWRVVGGSGNGTISTAGTRDGRPLCFSVPDNAEGSFVTCAGNLNEQWAATVLF